MSDQLDRDIEAAKRVPVDCEVVRDGRIRDSHLESETGVTTDKKEILEAACAAPRLAEEVERLREQLVLLTRKTQDRLLGHVSEVTKCLREEVKVLRQFIGITNDALSTDDALKVEREKYATLEKIGEAIHGVRKCRTCANRTDEVKVDEHRGCNRIWGWKDNPAFVAQVDGDLWFLTEPDFGCVLWEEKK